MANYDNSTDPNLDPNLLQYAGLQNPNLPQLGNPLLAAPGATGSALQGTSAPAGLPGSGASRWQGAQTGFDPATMQAMLALHGQANQQANVSRQRKLADQLRSDASGQLKGVQAGRTYVGPGWANLASSLGQSWMAGQQDRDASATASGLDKDYQTSMGKTMDEYKRQRDYWASQT